MSVGRLLGTTEVGERSCSGTSSERSETISSGAHSHSEPPRPLVGASPPIESSPVGVSSVPTAQVAGSTICSRHVAGVPQAPSRAESVGSTPRGGAAARASPSAAGGGLPGLVSSGVSGVRCSTVPPFWLYRRAVLRAPAFSQRARLTGHRSMESTSQRCSTGRRRHTVLPSLASTTGRAFFLVPQIALSELSGFVMQVINERLQTRVGRPPFDRLPNCRRDLVQRAPGFDRGR